MDNKATHESVRKSTAKPTRKYFKEIDWLKAFGALLVVLIHVMARYRGNSDLNYLMWDLAHFGVGAFVFASGFLQANAPLKIKSWKDAWKWFKKRFVRIVVPYYLFAVVYMAAYAFMEGGKSLLAKLDFEYIYRTILLIGGVGNNWIPRLFFWFTIVYLLLELFKLVSDQVFKIALKVTMALSIGIATYLMWWNISGFSKVNNVPGWFIIFLTGYFMYRGYEKHGSKWLRQIIAISASVLFGAFLFLSGTGQNLVIFNNKYPPNLYFISYNVLMVALTLGLLRPLAKFITKDGYLDKIIKYLSHSSYDIFFYHLVVFKLVEGFKFGIALDYLMIMSITMAIVVVKREILKIKI